MERQARALDKKEARLKAEAQAEAKEGLKRDNLESIAALGLVAAGAREEGEEEGDEDEDDTVPPQVLKERIESVVEVLSDFQVTIGCGTRHKSTTVIEVLDTRPCEKDCIH